MQILHRKWFWSESWFCFSNKLPGAVAAAGSTGHTLSGKQCTTHCYCFSTFPPTGGTGKRAGVSTSKEFYIPFWSLHLCLFPREVCRQFNIIGPQDQLLN